MNKNIKQIVFAGGCFWCTEAVFQRLDGVKEVVPGFSGGTIKNPAYREVITGRTGHAEAVKVVYDEEKIQLAELLEVFFGTHDPTTLNKQGNDVGTQYRSAIYYTSVEQKEQIESFVEILEKQKVFDNPIVTEIAAFTAFYEAETEHHDFYNQHTSQPYCQFIIEPKLKKLRTYYSDKLK
ncbi:peptide-methionine (S)-S-oxide reductase MsrA [Flavobacteriaceae bacterium TK19130]|nr:peptide-methionine (S)-S-oxide reductase MsrA [Thermobacterium salinum]